MTDIIDTVLLISEVEERPEIWDSSNENFRNKEVKDRSWEEIGSNCIRHFAELDEEEKQIAVVKLQKRWKTVRDAFKRTQAKGSSGSETKKTSKYYYHLKFLEGNMDLDSGETYYITDQMLHQVLEQSDVVDEEVQPIRTQLKSENSPRTRSKKNSSEEKCFKPSVAIHDGDKSFLESLLPTLESFNEEQRLQFRIEVLNALQRVKSLFPEQPPERTRGTLKSFVLTTDGELKEEPKKRPATPAERMRKMRERRKLEANLHAKNTRMAAQRMRNMRLPRKSEASTTVQKISTPISRSAQETCDTYPNSKRVKSKTVSSVREPEVEIDSVILIWTELLGYKLQEFDKLTREYLMNETDNNVFKAKIEMMKQDIDQGKEGRKASNSSFPAEVRYVDISNMSDAQHQGQDINMTSPESTATSASTQVVNKCEIFYVDHN